MKSWLVEHCGLGWGRAAEYVKVSQARREAFLSDETGSLDTARSGQPRRLRREVQCWKQQFEASPAESNALHARRHMSVYRQFGGMVRADGEWDPEGGTVVLTAVHAATDNTNRDLLDGRTFDQKTADASVDICRF